MIIAFFSIIFVGIALVIGRDNTAKALIGVLSNIIVLLVTVLGIWMGLNPWIVIIISCILMAVVCLFYQNEINQKTKTAFVSTGIMMILLGACSYYFVASGNLQGFPIGQYHIRESNGYLSNVGIDFKILQIGVVLIMLEGAMVDTSISVVAAMEEVSKVYKTKYIFESGLAVGRDILNSTINTLFFIFLGQNLVFFLYYHNDYTITSMINSKILNQELTSMLICAIGCVLIIPITAFIGSVLLNKSKS